MATKAFCVLNHAPPGEEPDRPTPEQMQRCCLYFRSNTTASSIWPPGACRRKGALRPALVPLPARALSARVPHDHLPQLCDDLHVAVRRHQRPAQCARAGLCLGRYPHGNRWRWKRRAAACAAHRRWPPYQQQSAAQMPDLSALLARAERQVVARDAQCDVKIGDYVEHFPRAPSFLAYAHVPRRRIGELAQRCGAP